MSELETFTLALVVLGLSIVLIPTQEEETEQTDEERIQEIIDNHKDDDNGPGAA